MACSGLLLVVVTVQLVLHEEDEDEDKDGGHDDPADDDDHGASQELQSKIKITKRVGMSCMNTVSIMQSSRNSIICVAQLHTLSG